MNNWYQKNLDNFNKERNTKAFYNTQGFEKLWSYYQVVVESDNFQQAVREMREKYDIPANGIFLPKKGT